MIKKKVYYDSLVSACEPLISKAKESVQCKIDKALESLDAQQQYVVETEKTITAHQCHYIYEEGKFLLASDRRLIYDKENHALKDVDYQSQVSEIDNYLNLMDYLRISFSEDEFLWAVLQDQMSTSLWPEIISGKLTSLNEIFKAFLASRYDIQLKDDSILDSLSQYFIISNRELVEPYFDTILNKTSDSKIVLDRLIDSYNENGSLRSQLYNAIRVANFTGEIFDAALVDDNQLVKWQEAALLVFWEEISQRELQKQVKYESFNLGDWSDFLPLDWILINDSYYHAQAALFFSPLVTGPSELFEQGIVSFLTPRHYFEISKNGEEPFINNITPNLYLISENEEALIQEIEKWVSDNKTRIMELLPDPQDVDFDEDFLDEILDDDDDDLPF